MVRWVTKTKKSALIKELTIKSNTAIQRKNPGSLKKTFKPGDFDPSIYDTFRKQQKFCDITLVSADGAVRLKGHRMVLAAKMKFVGTAFENLLEMNTAMDANTLKMVIEYCYSNEVKVTAYEQVFKLLKAAHAHEIPTLRGQCEEFLNASIGTKTAAKFLNLSNENGLDELACKCLSIMCEKFENVVNEPYFNDLSVQDFKQILESEQLCARNETFIFTAFLKWLYKADHMDLEQMEQTTMPASNDISDILTYIKFPLMDVGFFDKYARKICIHQNRLDLALEFSEFKLRALVCPNVAKKMENKRMQPRRSSEKLVIFGPDGPKMCTHSEMLRTNSMQEDWIQLPEIDQMKQWCKDAMSFAYCDHERVVATGGCDKLTSRQAKMVDLKTRKIVNLPPMNIARQSHASIFFEGFLYVAGGLKSKETLDSVERYDFNERRWTELGKMSTKRSHFTMVVADRFIYALGGTLGKQSLDAVDVYDPMNDNWTPGPPMIMRRSSASSVVYKDCIYAIGGFVDVESATVERYDGNEWKMMASLNMPRDHTACCLFQNTIVVAGGYNSKCEPMNIAEFYDEKDDKWHRLKPMNKGRGRAVMFATTSHFDYSD